MNLDPSANQLLYVEDDEALAAVTQRALIRKGFNVVRFASLQATAESLHNVHFDYALLDLKLQDGTSLELIETLYALNSSIRIVVLTGYASIATAVQAIKMGAVNYLSKPSTSEQIVRALFESDDAELEVRTKSNIDNEQGEDGYSLKRREWETIQQALKENGGNISATARQLKMHRRTLQRKLLKKPMLK